jgi:hypothetical protein
LLIIKVSTRKKSRCGINSGQFIDSGNIGHTRHRTMRNKTITQKAKKMSKPTSPKTGEEISIIVSK